MVRLKKWQWAALAVLVGAVFVLWRSGHLEGLLLALAAGGLGAAHKLGEGRRRTDKASEEARRTITRLEDLRASHEEEVKRIEEDNQHRTVGDSIARANERERRGDTTIR